MANQSPPTFTRTATDIQKIKDAILISLLFLSLCWVFFLMDYYLDYSLKSYGLRPRTLEGLRGIITVHFLHGDLKHIVQNSLGILVLNTFLFYFYREIAVKVFAWIFFLSPVLLWLVGRPSNHIGASVLLYGEFAFLFFSGIIRRNPFLLRVSLVVCLFYGSLVWYLFPIDRQISWEGHASGFAVGLVLAFVMRELGPQRKIYRFETEPELPDDENAYWKLPEEKGSTGSNETEQTKTTVTVKYHYQPEK